jgi:protein-S-isoprenylcysteine O-methyltransferase
MRSLPGYLGLIYLASELILSFTKRSRSKTPSRDAQSLRVLWVVITLSIVLSIYVAQKYRAGLLPHREVFQILGLAIFVIGLVFRFWAIIHLGRFFTVNVAIASDHRVIDSGPYRLVRHPSYTGSLLAFLGFALTIGNWLSLLVMLVPIFFAFVYRMNVEERALHEGLGENYAAYARRTKRLFPFLY